VLQRFADRLSAYHEAKLARHLETNTTAQGVEIAINGQQLLNFCSNDYLGLANHPQLKAAVIEGVQRYGVGAGAAALLSGHSQAHEVLEEQLARFLNRERALLFSSGYLANLGVLSGLVTRHDTVFHDKLNHASLIDGVQLSGAKHVRYPHLDVLALQAKISKPANGHAWLITDGVFSMDGDLAPLTTLANLAIQHTAILVCDDAHGFGVLSDGMGTVGHFGLSEKEVPILIVTFGKALGTVGAAVIGPAVIIEMLIQAARPFIYDTALPPAFAHATTVALTMLREQPELRAKLFSNIRYFHDSLAANDLPIPRSVTPIQPIIIGDASAALLAAAELRTLGLYVRAVRPPTVPRGTARLRICLSAAHTTSQLDRLIDGLCAIRSLIPIPPDDT
jgi:8-amino-7-oxononanoate synthase